MLIKITNKIKSFSQEIYTEFIQSISFHQLTCSCGHSGQLIKHAYYKRKIKTTDGIQTLIILRVKCKCCGKTHAVFPESIVPYSQILFSDHLKIITAYEEDTSFEPLMATNISIDESNIRYLIRQYRRHWRERLLAFDIPLDFNLAFHCLSTFKRQFMQMKCTTNILFS